MLPTALVAGAILVALSLYQNNVVQDAIGKRPASDNIVLYANLIGFLGAVLFTTLLSALHGLPEKQEQIGKMILLAILVIAFPFIDKLYQPSLDRPDHLRPDLRDPGTGT